MKAQRYALVVDDHPLVGTGLSAYLCAHELVEQVVSVTDETAAWSVITERGAPSLAVVDFWLIEGANLGFVRRLRLQHPSCPVLVISGDARSDLIERTRTAGAFGFVHKQEPPEQFEKAFRALLSGGLWYPDLMPATPLPSTASRSLSPPQPHLTAAELNLSPRQREILALMLQGLPNKRIAQRLDVSESTIKEHVTGILDKLGVRNRVEAITTLRDLGW